MGLQGMDDQNGGGQVLDDLILNGRIVADRSSHDLVLAGLFSAGAGLGGFGWCDQGLACQNRLHEMANGLLRGDR